MNSVISSGLVLPNFSYWFFIVLIPLFIFVFNCLKGNYQFLTGTALLAFFCGLVPLAINIGRLLEVFSQYTGEAPETIIRMITGRTLWFFGVSQVVTIIILLTGIYLKTKEKKPNKKTVVPR